MFRCTLLCSGRSYLMFVAGLKGLGNGLSNEYDSGCIFIVCFFVLPIGLHLGILLSDYWTVISKADTR